MQIVKTRIIAASIHFLASLFVISLSLSIIYFIWYPYPYYIIHSVFEAVKIVLSVDLVLGPFITLFIYNVLKPRKVLVRDVSIIIIIQIAALSWGLHITHKMRPIFLVFQADTFYPILKEEIDVTKLAKNIVAPGIWQRPKMVYIEPLKGEAVIQRMTNVALGGKIEGEMYQASKYKTLSLSIDNEYRKDVVSQAMPHSILFKSKTWKPGIDKLVSEQGGSVDEYLFYPVENDRLFKGIIALNKEDFSFVGVIESP